MTTSSISAQSAVPFVQQVIAGPGAGKTTYVLNAIMDRLATGTPPGAILGLTFTRKAAEEMHLRLKHRHPNQPLPWVGTFHALALQLLKAAGREPASIQDSLDQLIPFATAFLTAQPTPDWITRLHFVAIDETQDLDPTQVAFLQTLLTRTPPTCHVMLVGDPAQSIYGFRNASADFLLHPEQYLSRPVERVLLEENHRSAREIVHLAQQLLNDMPEAKALPLLLNPKRPESHPAILFLEAASAADEAQKIFEQIRTLLAIGVSPSDISILTRTRYQFKPLHLEAERWKIPVHTPPVKDVLDLPISTPTGPTETSPPSEATALDPTQPAINLLTIHQSKGREWLITFISGCQERFLPSHRATTKPALDEERRLLYVAVTRPKQLLWICHWGPLSRFLAVPTTKPLAPQPDLSSTSSPSGSRPQSRQNGPPSSQDTDALAPHRPSTRRLLIAASVVAVLVLFGLLNGCFH